MLLYFKILQIKCLYVSYSNIACKYFLYPANAQASSVFCDKNHLIKLDMLDFCTDLIKYLISKDLDKSTVLST